MASLRCMKNLENAACFELNCKENAIPIKLLRALFLTSVFVDRADMLKIELKLSQVLWLPLPGFVYHVVKSYMKTSKRSL